MSVPTRYNPKRLSDYTVRGGSGSPRGPSGGPGSQGIRASGPGRGNVGLTRDEMPMTQKERDAHKRIMASYSEAQRAHEGVMAGIAKAESAKFDKINDALNKSKESDPKDKLGNTVPSEQTKYLENQLIGIMGRAGQRSRKLTPKTAGMKPGQIDPATGKLPVKTTEGGTTAPATSRDESGAKLRTPYRTPQKGSKWTHPNGTVTLTGKSRQGPDGVQEVEATMGGKTGWVPFPTLKPVRVGRGGMEALEEYYAPKPDAGDNFVTL